MTTRNLKIAGAIGLFAAMATPQAHAQSAPSASEIESLQRQLRALEAKLDSVQKQTAANANRVQEQSVATANAVANANAAIPPKKAGVFPEVIVTMPGNRPTICTADKFNCVAITSRLHLDAATYEYRPNSALTPVQGLSDGVNARRARIGLLGTFQRDWEYGLILDGGGTHDGAASLNQAYITYRGFKSFANLAIDAGYIDVPYTLDEATSSNNTTFLERASPNVIATSINAGDNRSAFGARINDSWWWASAYVTGPVTGVSVSNVAAVTTASNHFNRQPLGATGRAIVVPINTNAGSLLLGGDISYLSTTGGAPGVNNLTLSDRIEVRVDPSSNGLLSTGALANIDSATVLSGEAAFGIGSFYAQGEYYNYSIKRLFGQSDLNFDGGYAQGSYVLTGESRKYNPSAGAYGGINPKNPVYNGGGWGAWEIAGRYSYVNLNDTDIGVGPVARGGMLRNTTVGLNWYATQNIRFMFNWINGEVEKRDALNRDIGGKYDVYAVRTQVAF